MERGERGRLLKRDQKKHDEEKKNSVFFRESRARSGTCTPCTVHTLETCTLRGRARFEDVHSEPCTL